MYIIQKKINLLFFLEKETPSNKENRPATKTELDELSQKERTLKREERTLKVVDSNITDYKTKYEQVTERIERLESRVDEVQEELSFTKQEFCDEKKKTASLEKKLAELTQQKDENNNKIYAVQQRLTESNSELAAGRRQSATSEATSVKEDVEQRLKGTRSNS